MFKSDYNKNIIEQVYFNNDKNIDKCIDLFLSGKIPKNNEQV